MRLSPTHAVLSRARPVTSLGHQVGRRVFWEGPKIFKLCPTHFSRGAKIFARGASPPPGYEPEKSHYTRVGADVGDKSMESRSVLQPLHTPLVKRPERRTSVVVLRWTHVLLCGEYKWMRCRDAVHSHTVDKWALISRSPGSMARRGGYGVAPLRQSSPGWMPARTGRLSVGVGHRHPVTVHKESLMSSSISKVAR